MNKKVFPVVTHTDKKLPYYLLSVGYEWEQEHIIREDGYYYQWIQCIKGEGEVIIGNKVYPVKEGTGIFLFLNDPHEYYPITPSWIVDWIVFDGHQVEYLLKEVIGLKTSGVYHILRPDITSQRIRAAADIAESDYSLKNIQCSGLLYSLLTDIMQYASINPDSSTLNKYYKIKPIIDYIDTHYEMPITLTDLAEFSNLTPQYLCTLFKKTTNIRLSQYINLVRLKKSKELLLQTPHMPIKEIARVTGFDDVNYFCSVFKKNENISPGQFRKIYSVNTPEEG